MNSVASIYVFLGVLKKLMLIGPISVVNDCWKIECVMSMLKSFSEEDAAPFLEPSAALGRTIAERCIEKLTKSIDGGLWGWQDVLKSRQFLAAVALTEEFLAEVPHEEKVAAMEELRPSNSTYASGSCVVRLMCGKRIDEWVDSLLNQAYRNVSSTLKRQPEWKPNSGIPYTDIGEDFRTIKVRRVILKLETPRWPINLAQKIRKDLRFGQEKSFDSFDGRDSALLSTLFGFLRYAHSAVERGRRDVGYVTAGLLILGLKRCADEEWMKETLSNDDMRAELAKVVENANIIKEHTRDAVSDDVLEILK